MIVTPNNINAAGAVIQYWTKKVHIAVFMVIFIAFIFGVNHIKRRSVPKKIARPPNYPQDGEEVDPDADLPDAGASRVLIPLGGEEERKIRASCKLAAETLRFAGSLVKVSRVSSL